MSTFSSDRVGETIIPDLTKRFRRGYIDYFDRKNGTDRPVEEIPTRSIIPLDQFEELMKLLDDIVLFSAATPELATKFQGLWNRLDLPDKDDKDRIECTRMGLISFESYIKVFIYLLCGNGDLLRQIDAEKRGLGYILNNLSVPSPDGKSGLFDARYAGLFDTLRRYRNGITHSPSDTGVSESDILTVRKNPNDAYDELFLLTLTGLLLLLHHHAGYYRRYLDEHRPELPPEKAAAASPARRLRPRTVQGPLPRGAARRTEPRTETEGGLHRPDRQPADAEPAASETPAPAGCRGGAVRPGLRRPSARKRRLYGRRAGRHGDGRPDRRRRPHQPDSGQPGRRQDHGVDPPDPPVCGPVAQRRPFDPAPAYQPQRGHRRPNDGRRPADGLQRGFRYHDDRGPEAHGVRPCRAAARRGPHRALHRRAE